MASDSAPATASNPTAALVGALNTGRYRRWKELAGYALVLWTLGTKAYTKAKAMQSSRSFSVTVCDLDDIYVDVQRWLLDRIPESERRGLNASSHKGRLPRRPPGMDSGDELDCVPGGSKRPTVERRVHLTYDGSKSQTVDIDGHRVTVTSETRTYGNANEGNYGTPAKVTFTAADRAGRDAAVGFLQEVATAFELARQDNAADIWIGTRWGDWTRVREIPPRPLESVILAGDLRERLVDDLARFLADEETYVRLGMPYHRGYLLHGPPGTGKTSVAKVLAGHFGMDIYCLPLSSMKEDTDIGRMLAQIGPRAMLLIEDVDVIRAAKDRDAEGAPADGPGGVTQTGLLNALDGLATPHGLVTLLTTNKIEALDPALIRPGRADQRILIDHLDDEQLGRLVCSIYGDWKPDMGGMIPWLNGRLLTPAAVIEAIKPHLDAPDAGFRAVSALIAATELADA